LSISLARRKRTALFCSIAGLMFIVAALSAISARDPDGVTIRTGMILLTVGAAMWLPWQALLPVAIGVWLVPNLGRNLANDYPLFDTNMMLELPGTLGLAAISSVARICLRELERENLLLGMNAESAGVDPATGVYEESQLRGAIEAELSRSRRFGRSFALVLVGIDELRQRFDYRDEELWQASFAATADLLRGTRNNVDRVYRFGPAGFALILPESGAKEIGGMVRRLRRVARQAKPAEGEPGGPLPAHYGATFFPTCATTTADLLRRAEIALRISDNNANRIQLDGAEAPEMPPLETLRQPETAIIASAPAAESVLEDAVETPTLRIVESADNDVEELEGITTAEPAFASAETVEGADASETIAPILEPTLLKTESEVAELEVEPVAPQPLFPVATAAAESEKKPDDSAHPETMEKAPVAHAPAVFAYHAPEPAVDAPSSDWQAEAPLSVIRRPQTTPRLVSVKSGGAGPKDPVDDVISDALKQLDSTLELIRSLKKRSA
jgi:diguanylate cyclase (GGDEF)-like protein